MYVTITLSTGASIDVTLGAVNIATGIGPIQFDNDDLSVVGDSLLLSFTASLKKQFPSSISLYDDSNNYVHGKGEWNVILTGYNSTTGIVSGNLFIYETSITGTWKLVLN